MSDSAADAMSDSTAYDILGRARYLFGDTNPLVQPPLERPPSVALDPAKAARLRRMFGDGKPPRGRPPHPRHVGQRVFNFGDAA